MSLEAERVKLETTFQTAWAASAYASVPVIYDNVPLKQPKTDFVMHQIISGSGMQKEIAGTGPVLHRYVGLVQVDILCTLGSGSSVAKKMADVAASIYRRVQLTDSAGANIVFRTPSFKQVGALGERFRLIVDCPYYRDIRH